MKKLFSALMSLSLLAGVAAMPAAAAETYSLGDVDMNGVVDTVDVMCALENYVSTNLMFNGDVLTDAQKALADINEDAVIDTVDAACILIYYVYTLSEDEPMSFADYRADGRLPVFVYITK